ncbi:hypothetical protein G7092_05840 [Mucilaginibacter sp. HC2]|uniref:hypothetical protein n=1 Tax=Mucilaginibacter inviolabilis TaxID=2714892 RepID=UPI0014092F63|nr:hypothetical protein [Mucilaginibacter inviolabilis]NHA03303.1 hypothetical protein [Mucilaginibacter inviolabilis]
MLKDELKLLAEWAARFSSAYLPVDPLAKTFLTEQVSLYQAECMRIKKVWTDLLFSQAKDHVIKRYISFQQQVIQELADNIYELSATSKDRLRAEPAEALLACLLDLRNFQIQYFNTFINENGRLPRAVLPALSGKITESAKRLIEVLPTTEMDVYLRTCILDYLSGVIGTGHLLSGTYREVEYISSFLKNLTVILAVRDGQNLTEHVTEMLFHINFNHNVFIKWYQEDVERKMESFGTAEQDGLLMKQLLLLKSIPVSITTSYDPSLPPVSISLEIWLKEYIKQVDLQGEFSDSEKTGKLELKLTVAQMALLIRLFYEEGVFALKNITELMKFFAVHFTSKKQGHISYGSMNKLYYSADQFTGYAVRELLLKMTAKVNKMYFPT